MIHFRVQKCKLKQVLSQEGSHSVSLCNLSIALKETIGTGLLDFELQMEKDALLHSQNLRPCVSIVRQIDEILDVWWINFFILGCDEKRCHTHELYVALHHVEDRKVTIDQVNGEEECLWQQLKFSVHTNNPIDKNSTNVLINVSLVAHVKAIWLREFFCHLHVLLNFLAVETHMVDIAQCGLVNF